MKFYRVSVGDRESSQYSCTRDEGHADLKRAPGTDARMELVEIETDQSSIVNLLNGNGASGEVLRTWMLTPRGGLKEVPNGE